MATATFNVSRPVICSSAAQCHSRSSIRCAAQPDRHIAQTPLKALPMFAVGAAAAVQLAFGGPALAALDTETSQKGLAATIEYSDIQDQDALEVAKMLNEKLLPMARDELQKVASGSYDSSIVKELETVQGEVNQLIEQVKAGKNISNIKSTASGIEQQLNALKATLGVE